MWDARATALSCPIETVAFDLKPSTLQRGVAEMIEQDGLCVACSEGLACPQGSTASALQESGRLLVDPEAVPQLRPGAGWEGGKQGRA